MSYSVFLPIAHNHLDSHLARACTVLSRDSSQALQLLKDVKHTGILGLNYISRSDAGKIRIGEVGGIAILVDVLKDLSATQDNANTTQSRHTCLAILW